MHIRSLASVAILAFAAQAFAQQEPKVFKRSITTLSRDLGFMRRADGGYQPEDEVCSKGGNTCAEACGSGYQQCKSTDQAVHCYNPAAGETCCSTNTGNSCLSAFYCTHDPKTETFCCPNGMNLADCAIKHGVTGALTSDVPVPTTTSTSQAPTSSSIAPTTTSTTSSVVLTTSSTVVPTTSVITTSSFVPSVGTSSVFAAANSTFTSSTRTGVSTRVNTAPTTVSTPAAPDQNAGSSNAPAGMVVLLGAALAAALL
ncbi:PRP 4 C domain-containing protein [Colletotrichum truncatum]|uniref:PRP 4 C domain-containing protein n=1 Tax=Colletotrichum truncatum TaxID=5467 RepID=A0ACC3YMZ2_COLTU|nr:PRP 4 C domain-containing protein [Colletotrichum truncatum]KAF6792158.1 PRP 4 C domain-containing protein [Colletotrichum truncatum]